MRRFMIGMAALAVPLATTSIGMLETADPAGAAAPVNCATVSGSETTLLTFKGCGGGLGKGSASGDISPGATITWKGRGKGTTTIDVPAVTAVGQGACKAGSTEFDESATVTADSTALSTQLVGSTLSFQVCVDASGKYSLVKHTVVSL